MAGIEEYLLQQGYSYFVASHRHRPDLIDEYPKLLMERSNGEDRSDLSTIALRTKVCRLSWKKECPATETLLAMPVLLGFRIVRGTDFQLQEQLSCSLGRNQRKQYHAICK
jgi:hypothetical protein